MKNLFTLLVALVAIAETARADVEWTIWEGSMNASSSGNQGSWDNSLYLNNNNFANLEAGDVIYFYLTKNNNASGQAQVALYYQNTLVVGETTTWPETSLTTIDTDGNCSYTVTSDNLKYFQGYYDGECTSVSFINLVVKGRDFTLTKVSIKKHNSVIKYTISDADKNMGQWDTYYEQASLPVNVSDGDFFYITAKQQTGTYNDKWDSNTEKTISYWSMQFQNIYDDNSRKWYYPTNSFNHDIWKKIESTDVGTINTAGTVIAKGQFYNATGFYLLHPVSSFSIGSIGYATFSATQQVTAPAGVTAYKATISGDNSYVSLTPFANNVIPANTGAIIAGSQGAVLEFTASSAETSESSDLIACTSSTDVATLAESGYDLYVLYPGTGESETNLELSTLLSSISDWGGKVTVSTSEPWTAEWTSSSTSSAMGKWLGSDWSTYDKLRLVFTSNTVAETVHFGLSYSGQSDSENTGADLATGELTVDIPLNASHNSAMGNFSFNSNATSGSLTFESAALIDSDGATVAEFRKTTSGTLAANKAYLKIANNASPARLAISFGKSDVTGISTVAHEVQQTDNRIYSLSGQKVKSVSKGLYIKNGKKYVVK